MEGVTAPAFAFPRGSWDRAPPGARDYSLSARSTGAEFPDGPRRRARCTESPPRCFPAWTSSRPRLGCQRTTRAESSTSKRDRSREPNLPHGQHLPRTGSAGCSSERNCFPAVLGQVLGFFGCVRYYLPDPILRQSPPTGRDGLAGFRNCLRTGLLANPSRLRFLVALGLLCPNDAKRAGSAIPVAKLDSPVQTFGFHLRGRPLEVP
jgi:hypothetical protein